MDGKVWCLLAKAGQEDGNYATCSIYMHFLRQAHCKATLCWDLELPSLQENRGRWRLECLVSPIHKYIEPQWLFSGEDIFSSNFTIPGRLQQPLQGLRYDVYEI